MNLQLSEIINLYFELNGINKTEKDKEEVLLKGILKQKLSLISKVYLTRLNKILTEEYKLFEELRIETFKKYAVEINNEFVIEENKIKDFSEEIESLLKTEKNINTNEIWGNNLNIEIFNDVVTDEYYPVFIKLIEEKFNLG